MYNGHPSNRYALRFEISLITLFLVIFALYVADALPAVYKTDILAGVGAVGLIPVARNAVRSLREKQISVDLLATIALFFSLITAEWGSMLFINLMLSGARTLDIYTKRRVHLSLEGLMKLKPTKARVIRGEHTVEIPIEDIDIDDLVVVDLGEQIPVDGIVTSGSASVNHASLTGESVPILCEAGARVLSATVVASGNIIVRTERIGKETTFERMIDLVQASHDAKTKMRTLAERFASWYIGIMLLVAIVLYAVTQDTSLVLAVVLVVCADDIAIAVPMAYIIAIGTAARRGIIVKSADYLENVGKMTKLVVDKTGTLTLGKLTVSSVRTFGETTTRELLDLSGMICARSNHPVSKAIIAYARERGCACLPPEHFSEIEGRGIIGVSTNGKKLIIGRDEFLKERGVVISDEIYKIIAENITRGQNVTLLALDNTILGMFTLADEIREGLLGTIASLKRDGVGEMIMLTGDNEGVAKNIAAALGIDKYYSRLLPEHKVLVLKDHLGKRGHTVGMVGDGVNDAAVLMRADVGIAMGGIGSDVAIESADIVLMQDDFNKIVEIREISHKVLAIVRGNFVIWGIVNAIGLYFVFTHVFDPSRAAAYNFLTDFIPIANSLRLFYYRKKTV
ncbi:MAG: cation-translocating P-type ATPase [Candidatus Yonathbacteria bacterium]|nr:cation-translocating P-type ATPase [Candidatus Yonathbacteria bacterium]